MTILILIILLIMILILLILLKVKIILFSRQKFIFFIKRDPDLHIELNTTLHNLTTKRFFERIIKLFSYTIY